MSKILNKKVKNEFNPSQQANVHKPQSLTFLQDSPQFKTPNRSNTNSQVPLKLPSISKNLPRITSAQQFDIPQTTQNYDQDSRILFSSTSATSKRRLLKVPSKNKFPVDFFDENQEIIANKSPTQEEDTKIQKQLFSLNKTDDKQNQILQISSEKQDNIPKNQQNQNIKVNQYDLKKMSKIQGVFQKSNNNLQINTDITSHFPIKTEVATTTNSQQIGLKQSPIKNIGKIEGQHMQQQVSVKKINLYNNNQNKQPNFFNSNTQQNNQQLNQQQQVSKQQQQLQQIKIQQQQQQIQTKQQMQTPNKQQDSSFNNNKIQLHINKPVSRQQPNNSDDQVQKKQKIIEQKLNIQQTTNKQKGQLFSSNQQQQQQTIFQQSQSQNPSSNSSIRNSQIIMNNSNCNNFNAQQSQLNQQGQQTSTIQGQNNNMNSNRKISQLSINQARLSPKLVISNNLELHNMINKNGFSTKNQVRHQIQNTECNIENDLPNQQHQYGRSIKTAIDGNILNQNSQKKEQMHFPKLALNQESEKYKPFLIRKINSSESNRAYQINQLSQDATTAPDSGQITKSKAQLQEIENLNQNLLGSNQQIQIKQTINSKNAKPMQSILSSNEFMSSQSHEFSFSNNQSKVFQ